ncbi:MAG: FAD-dependent oxidoreductase [Syntrophothermus sp.]|uniref:FAD-dependent oxidoreductase n=1 Tax=Syntrophothermus sp. TaxID=2736299 RepID=UPI00257C2EFD|nr:FAD-dependent oxidoreductase [Syntrophothermus sp.]NSW84259.1 FAD-dependent oxidoreductase [Syntrophothermus sp.]
MNRKGEAILTNKIGRRSFIKGMAVAGVAVAGAGVLTGCRSGSSSGSAVPTKWDKEADIVIVGGGGTGIVAAIVAREKGSSVIVLEKAAMVGGTTSLSGGVIQAAGTKFQKEFTRYQDDTPEKHYEYWMQAAEGLADPKLVKAMAYNAPSNIDWLVAHGLTYVSVYGVAPIPYIDPELMTDRIHVPGGAGKAAKAGTGQIHVKILYELAQKKGAEFMLETPVGELIYDPKKGVVGVRAQSGGKEIAVKAKKGVILATGGFDHNKDMAKTFSPQQFWAMETGAVLSAPTNTGDGIRMAMALGADLAAMGGTIGVPFYNVAIAPLSQDIPEVPGIYVNKYGLRFVNEATHYAYCMRAVFNQEGHEAWAIFDENTKNMGGEVIGGIFKPWSHDLSKEIADGSIKTAGTIRELAAKIGVNADNLEYTVNRWNSDTAKGKDTMFNKQLGLKPIARAPFYAAKVKEGNLGTCGGLKINTKGQVMNVEGKVIPRLYAGGMCAGGFIGPYYPGSGTAIAATVYFGRLCAQNACQEQPWE